VLPNYNEQYVTHLFDQMSPSYDVVNLISSFGFSEIWRAQCVHNLNIQQGTVVADLMAGSGECWSYLKRRIKTNGQIVSVDISPVMCSRQKRRIHNLDTPVDIRCENALSMSLPDKSVDFIISAFGLKTFDSNQLSRLASELLRILRPGGSCSLLEITMPELQFFRIPYRFYINAIIPLIGRIFLKDIECYKMLGVYTEAFGSCAKFADIFRNAGFEVVVKKHFFGCASSLVLTKTNFPSAVGATSL
jgi:demethylmenaquinone methyltransferase/2-methoxy-6-polyprenyl-1,4-benzoquinol methylase